MSCFTEVPTRVSQCFREVALEILSQQDIGSFLVRDSTTHPGCYALSVKVPKYDNPSGISHYLITRTPQNTVRFKVRLVVSCYCKFICLQHGYSNSLHLIFHYSLE